MRAVSSSIALIIALILGLVFFRGRIAFVVVEHLYTWIFFDDLKAFVTCTHSLAGNKSTLVMNCTIFTVNFLWTNFLQSVTTEVLTLSMSCQPIWMRDSRYFVHLDEWHKKCWKLFLTIYYLYRIRHWTGACGRCFSVCVQPIIMWKCSILLTFSLYVYVQLRYECLAVCTHNEYVF